MKTSRRNLLTLAVLGLALAGCSHGAGVPADTLDQELESQLRPDVTPALTVEDQAIVASRVTIANVASDRPAWAVAYADDEGQPGAVLGQTLVRAGDTADVAIEIDLAAATGRLFVLLHTDADVLGDFDFPGGEDKPIDIDGISVARSFNVTNLNAPAAPAGGGEPAAEAADGEPSAAVHAVTMVARQWDFQPDTITVNRGDKVQVAVESVDVAHGIAIPAFGINEFLSPGQDVSFEFTADKAGTFPFVCSHFCGSGHGGMRGSVIVR